MNDNLDHYRISILTHSTIAEVVRVGLTEGVDIQHLLESLAAEAVASIARTQMHSDDEFDEMAQRVFVDAYARYRVGNADMGNPQ